MNELVAKMKKPENIKKVAVVGGAVVAIAVTVIILKKNGAFDVFETVETVTESV